MCGGQMSIIQYHDWQDTYLEDQVLHPEDLPLSVSVIGDVDKLRHIGRVDLLVLGSDEHRGGADQLQFRPLHGHQGEKPERQA